MSYDLHFKRQKGLTASEFNDYFANRPFYEVSNGQAWYKNPITGVYFCFELPVETEGETADHVASFNMNFYRPHFFALEAAPEVEAFNRHFMFSISDPQSAGMGEGEFTTNGFLVGWNHGNEFGYRALLGADDGPKEVHTQPTIVLERVWRWNYEKEAIQARLGENVFVPKIFWVLWDAKPASAIVWPDGIATLIPEVDLLVIPRDELAPSRFFKKQKDQCVIPGHAVESVLTAFDRTSFPIPARVPTYVVAPAPVRKFVQSLSPNKQELNGVSTDAILNAEIVERTMRKT